MTASEPSHVRPSASLPTEPWAGQTRRSLRNYLLDNRYQLRFTGIFVAVSALLATGFGWLVYHFVTESSRVIYTSKLLTGSEGEAAQLRAQLEYGDHLLAAGLVTFGLLLCVVLTVYCIILTHKVAGPLYKIKLYMNQIRDGRLGQIYDLRRGDELVDFFETFRQLHEALVRRAVEEVGRLEGAIEAAERVGAGEAVQVLKAIHQEKAQSLK